MYIRYIAHCASPFQFSAPGGDPQTGFVDPALNGTNNVLSAALRAGSVKRMVFTSSCAAVSWVCHFLIDPVPF